MTPSCPPSSPRHRGQGGHQMDSKVTQLMGQSPQLLTSPQSHFQFGSQTQSPRLGPDCPLNLCSGWPPLLRCPCSSCLFLPHTQKQCLLLAGQ